MAVAVSILAAGTADAQRGTRNNNSASQSSSESSSQASSESAPAAAPAAEKAAPEEKKAEAAPAPQAPPPPAVTYVTMEAQDITITSLLPGRVVASGVAEVRPQVDGIIIERVYDEGADVTLGDPLYRIDPATYAARVAAAKAAVAQAQATYNQALNDATRNEQLRKRGVTSEQTLEAAIATRDTASAALQVAQAELQQAEIDLDRTTIRAQLSGVAGRSITTQGALVTAGQSSPLAVIRNIDPVLVDVTQSAAEILEFRRGRLQDRLNDTDTSVALILADGTEYSQRGELTAAEPYVNESTGVVTLRLQFDNPDHLLLPGMYIQVQMPQGTMDNVILAPQEGVTRNRRGLPIAYIVNGDDVIEERQLKTAGTRGNTWIVTGGLEDGDRMVVAGLQRIRPGAKVRPQERPAAAVPDATPAGAAAPDAPDADVKRDSDGGRSAAATTEGSAKTASNEQTKSAPEPETSAN
ncbi:efflux RND transporter periplasmic adaptor subunit [Acuticoccus sediminis]|uniref:efflux RND transporter periplasmic adaptor subunit n=1 Tax=Acuticoccus sediminis TaxID=2184697 RepID=UPI001CFCA9B9|nr:efflux RND transporter periplasmic adaptor subunit [Acuticoccus sediminis]